MSTYSWQSGGQWYIIQLPRQEPGESDDHYAKRLADIIAAAHQQHPPD